MCFGGVKCNADTTAEHIPEPPARRRVVCYPVQLATPASLPAAVVERKEQGDMTILTYHGDNQRLNTPYFYKLVMITFVCASVCSQLHVQFLHS